MMCGKQGRSKNDRSVQNLPIWRDSQLLTLEAAEAFWREIGERYEQRKHDRERPLLAPADVFQPVDALFAALKAYRQIQIARFDADDSSDHYASRVATALPVDARAERFWRVDRTSAALRLVFGQLTEPGPRQRPA